jgi:hypothetical protein
MLPQRPQPITETPEFKRAKHLREIVDPPCTKFSTEALRDTLVKILNDKLEEMWTESTMDNLAPIWNPRLPGTPPAKAERDIPNLAVLRRLCELPMLT